MSDLRFETFDPRLHRLFQYWDQRRRGRAFPARRDIDPADMAYILGHVMLVDVYYDPLRFRFRLHGSELTRRGGYDMTGKEPDALPGEENRRVLIERCHSLVQGRRPQIVRSARVADGQMLRYEALWMPLSEDGDAINMLLGALIYRDKATLNDSPQDYFCTTCLDLQ